MKKTQPLDQETTFYPHELFFSKTDKRGIIQSGNAVFIRVSQFEKHVLIGAAHNIVRHPDMPKAVFQFFWDTLQKGAPIGAYVKNMSKSGSFYWVFAVVWPTQDGYLSLRLKPTSAILSTVQKLYRSILAEEKNQGVAVALEMLNRAIKDLGFASYQEFMSAALVSELSSRDQLLTQRGHAACDLNSGPLGGAIERNSAIGIHYESIFRTLMRFLETGETISKSAEFTIQAFRSLSFLSLNMAVSAEKAGNRGLTLAEVSNGFRKIADDVHTGILEFIKTMNELKQTTTASQFQIGGARLQMEMIRAFLMEVQTSNKNSLEQNYAEMKENFFQLSDLASRSTATVRVVLTDTRSKLKQFIVKAEELSTATNGLEVIRISAKIEASKLNATQNSTFQTHIDEMTSFVKSVSKPLTDSRTAASTLLRELDDSTELLQLIQQLTDEMKAIVNDTQAG